MDINRRKVIYSTIAPFTASLGGCAIVDREIDHSIMVYNGTEGPQTPRIRIALDDEQVFNEQLTIEPGSRSKIASIDQPAECQIVVETEADRYTESLSLPPNDRYDSRSYTNINFSQNYVDEDYVEFRSYVLD